MTQLQTVLGKTPHVGEDCFLAPSAVLIGDVTIGPNCSLWYNVVVRGDVMPIRIGAAVNLQDNTVLHGTHQQFGVSIADRVTIGHSVVLHGCEIGRESLIGMGSLVMDGVTVGEQCLVGAGSLLPPGAQFPARKLILGRPAKVIRDLTPDEIKSLAQSADNYLLYKTWYEAEANGQSEAQN